jgi:hypothetical protein
VFHYCSIEDGLGATFTEFFFVFRSENDCYGGWESCELVGFQRGGEGGEFFGADRLFEEHFAEDEVVRGLRGAFVSI